MRRPRLREASRPPQKIQPNVQLGGFVDSPILSFPSRIDPSIV
jgi:hypothetical protein